MTTVIASYWFGLLVFLPLAVLYFVFRRKARRTSAVRFPLLSIVKKSGSGVQGKFFSLLSFFLNFIALILIILALMRFQSKVPMPADYSSSFDGTDIMICLDTSPSMLAVDFGRDDRITVAKEVISEFIKGRPNDRIGLVVFAGASLTMCPLTLDHGTLIDLTSSLEQDVTKTDGTAIGDALATSINRLKNSAAKSKVIILVTDGSNNMGHIDPNTAAEIAKKLGIKIYSIGVGKEGISQMPIRGPLGITRYVPIEDSLDEPALRKLADISGGEYSRAKSIDSLKLIFNRIDSLEKTEFKKQASFIYSELFNFFLIPAFIMLLLDVLLTNTIARRIP